MNDDERYFREQNAETFRVIGRVRERNIKAAKHHVVPVHRGKARKSIREVRDDVRHFASSAWAADDSSPAVSHLISSH